MKEITRKFLDNKILFVNELSKAFAYNPRSGINKIEYVVVEINDDYYEFVVVHYNGGAIQARNCDGNSESCIFEEISKMLYSSQVFTFDTEMYKNLIK